MIIYKRQIIVFVILLLIISCEKRVMQTEASEVEAMNGEEKQEKRIDIFESSIFEDIALSPLHYQSDSRLNIAEVFYSEKAMEKQYYDGQIIVKNDDIQIYYWINGSSCQLKIVVITGNTDITKWGKHIGASRDEVHSLFGAPREDFDTQLNYRRDDLACSVIFVLEKNRVVKIELVGSI